MQLIAYIAGYLYLALGLSIMTDGPLMDVLEGYSTLYKLPPQHCRGDHPGRLLLGSRTRHQLD